MYDDRLIEALIARADDDAERFRETYPDDIPTERWIENSFTAAVPLAGASAGTDPGPGPHPDLFAIYRREINRRIGERVSGRDDGDDLKQMQTAGQH